MARVDHIFLSARRSYLSEFAETRDDFVRAASRWRLALSLAIHDIASRYRGSILGPWWITLSMGALVLGIGINYAALFHIPVNELLPYVALGIVFWSYISTCMMEGGDAFYAAGGMLRQSSLPLPLFIMRTMMRNLINLGHHVVIIVVVLCYFRHFPGFGIVWSLAGLVLASINLGWVMTLLAFVAARYRDIPQIIGATIQITFFLTPVFWKVTPAMESSPFVQFNPFYFIIESMREPLLTGRVPVGSFELMAMMAVMGWTVTILVYNQTRRRVVHYI